MHNNRWLFCLRVVNSVKAHTNHVKLLVIYKAVNALFRPLEWLNI